MATITTGAFAKLLWPGLNAVYGEAYKDWDTEYTKLFDTYKSSQNWEEDLGVSGFGLATVKPEGTSISYDTERQAFLTRYIHFVVGNGFIVTREMLEDNLYKTVGPRRAKNLARSMRQSKETHGANVYNRAFNGSYTGGDGLEMCSTAHVNVAGGTWQNELTTAADLSEASLEQALIDIGGWTDDRGLKVAAKAVSLHIPRQLEFEAERILMSPYRPGIADNDVNALYTMGKFPKGVHMNHYLTDADAWFIRTDVDNGVKHFQRRPLQFSIDNDFDSENAKFKATERYVFGWSDPRGVFGSPGI